MKGKFICSAGVNMSSRRFISVFVSAKFAHKFAPISQQVSVLALVHGKEVYFIGYNLH